MSASKIWLTIAIVLSAIGLIIFIVGMSFLKWDFTKLSTYKFTTKSYEISENYTSFSISVDTADISFVPSQNGETSVVCYEQEKLTHSVEVIDGVLTIKVLDKREWYDHIGISFSSPKITVTLPQSTYENLDIKTKTGHISIPSGFSFSNATFSASTGRVNFDSQVANQLKITANTGDVSIKNVNAKDIRVSTTTGNISISSATAESLVASVSTGKISILDVECASFSSTGSTGDIVLKNLIATQTINIERNTGNVNFDGCDASEIQVKTNTGDIKGTLLSSKIFIANTTTGHKQVPESTEGGKCKLTTTTGNIIISIK